MAIGELRVVRRAADDRGPDAPSWRPMGAQASAADIVACMYDRYHRLVFHLALRYGKGARAWAEDLTHDVFLQLFARAHEVDAMANVPGWFYRVTTNRCLNRLDRDRQVQRPILRWFFEDRRPPPVPDELGIVGDELARVFRRVDAMPDKLRVCFYMRHIDDRSVQEIAEVLGHSKGYVSKLLAQVDARLQRLAREEAAR